MPVQWQKRIKTHWAATGKRETHQDYYAVRACDADYSQYWGEQCDPDGQVRDRLSEEERCKYVADMWEELEFVSDLPRGKIVDIGCGPGWFLRELDGWYRVGVEIAPQALAALERAGIECYESTQDVDSYTADVVMCHHVIEHVPDPMAMMYEVRRILKRGGWLVMGTPDFESPCAIRFGANYRMLHDPTHCSLFTLESAHRMLRDYGFQVMRQAFPFPERYATESTWRRWHDTSNVSPPWPGNWFTLYAQIPGG